MKINKLITVPVAGLLALGAVSMASAQVIGPRVALQFATNGLTSPLVTSTSNAVIARLLLDTTASTEAVRISSLPFNLITANGASAGSLQNCRVYNETDLNNSLNTPATATTTLFTGVNNIALNNALVLQSNTMTTLSLRCDINDTLVAGGTYTVNMNTANVVAAGGTTGIPAVVTVRGAVVVPPITPGIPATGVKSPIAQSAMMLLASLGMATLGFSYLSKKPARQSIEK